jgi:hypothetical protein
LLRWLLTKDRRLDLLVHDLVVADRPGGRGVVDGVVTNARYSLWCGSAWYSGLSRTDWRTVA